MWRGIKHDFVLDEDEYGEFCVIPLAGGEYFAKVDVEDFEQLVALSDGGGCSSPGAANVYIRRQVV